MNSMEDRSVFDLFNGEDVRYRVPIYQRHYVWNETHWQHIWDDIAEKANSTLKLTGMEPPVPHFTGVIVTRKNENGEVEIVDGQQRLTTFQIIFCAIRDVCMDICRDEKGEFQTHLDLNAVVEHLDNLLNNSKRSTHDTSADNIYKLLPTEGPDREAFRKLVTRAIDDSAGLLLRAYIDFKEKISSYVRNDYERVVALSQTLLFYFKIVEMGLKQDDPAAKIFESLNGRGLPLTQFDLLRNNVFLRAGDKRHRLYEKCWQHFNDEPIWFSDEIVDDFLSNFLQAKLNYEYDPKRSLFDLYQRDYIGKLRQKLGIDMDDEDNPKLVEHEFEELQQYSRVYAAMINCDEESPIWFYQFLKTDLLKTTSWHPLILLLKSELKLSEEDEKKIFRILESYVVRQFLCYPEIPEWIRESEYRQLRRSIVDRIQSGNSSFEEIKRTLEKQKGDWQWPCDIKVTEALKNIGNHWSTPLQKYILFKIERKMTDTNLTINQLAWSTKLTREHVMPRGWKNATKDETDDATGHKSTVDLWPVARSDDEAKRYQYVESIGNLTLLTDDANQRVATDPFSKKKERYGDYSRLSITNYIVSQDDWDVEQISERAQNLVNLFNQIWPSSADKC